MVATWFSGTTVPPVVCKGTVPRAVMLVRAATDSMTRTSICFPSGRRHLVGMTPEYEVLTAPPTVAGVMPSADARAGSTVIPQTGSMTELLTLAMGFATRGLHANPEISLDNPNLIKQPFGAAVAAATVFSFVLAHWRH